MTKFNIIFNLKGSTFNLTRVAVATLEPVMANIFCYKDTEGHGSRFAGYQDKDLNGKI